MIDGGTYTTEHEVIEVSAIDIARASEADYQWYMRLNHVHRKARAYQDVMRGTTVIEILPYVPRITTLD